MQNAQMSINIFTINEKLKATKMQGERQGDANPAKPKKKNSINAAGDLERESPWLLI